MDARKLPRLLETYRVEVPSLFKGRNLKVACIQENAPVPGRAAAGVDASTVIAQTLGELLHPGGAGTARSAVTITQEPPLSICEGGGSSDAAPTPLLAADAVLGGEESRAAAAAAAAATPWLTSAVPGACPRLATLYDGSRLRLVGEAALALPLLAELSLLERTYIKGGTPEQKHALLTVFAPCGGDGEAEEKEEAKDEANLNKEQGRRTRGLGLHRLPRAVLLRANRVGWPYPWQAPLESLASRFSRLRPRRRRGDPLPASPWPLLSASLPSTPGPPSPPSSPSSASLSVSAASSSWRLVVANVHLDAAGGNAHRTAQLRAVGAALASVKARLGAGLAPFAPAGRVADGLAAVGPACRAPAGMGLGDGLRRRDRKLFGALARPPRGIEGTGRAPVKAAFGWRRRQQRRQRPRRLQGAVGGDCVWAVVAGDTNCFQLSRRQQSEDLASMVAALQEAYHGEDEQGNGSAADSVEDEEKGAGVAAATSPQEQQPPPGQPQPQPGRGTRRFRDPHARLNPDTHWFSRTDEEGLGHRAAAALGRLGIDAPRRYDVVWSDAKPPLPPPPPHDPNSTARGAASNLHHHCDGSSEAPGGASAGTAHTPDSDHDLVWAHFDLTSSVSPESA